MEYGPGSVLRTMAPFSGGGRPAVARIRTAVPHLSALYLSRPRLSAALDAAAEGEVALVSAPAGYGKTLLLADWVQRRHNVAWLTLDRDDNTDRRFWAGVLAALATVTDIPASNPVHTLELPEAPSRSPAFLATLVDGLAAAPSRLVMVFDDVQALTHQNPLSGLANLIENRPPGLQIVLASRSDPPLRLDDQFQGLSGRRRRGSVGRAGRCGRCARSRR